MIREGGRLKTPFNLFIGAVLQALLAICGGISMKQNYNRDYTREEIAHVLANIKSCIKKEQYVISQNESRLENINFIQEYNIRAERQKEILLGIQAEDFCYMVNNLKKGFEHEALYVFVPQVGLYRADGEEEAVDIYTKFNVIDKPSGKRAVVISFHKRNKPVTYLFR